METTTPKTVQKLKQQQHRNSNIETTTPKTVQKLQYQQHRNNNIATTIPKTVQKLQQQQQQKATTIENNTFNKFIVVGSIISQYLYNQHR